MEYNVYIGHYGVSIGSYSLCLVRVSEAQSPHHGGMAGLLCSHGDSPALTQQWGLGLGEELCCHTV